MDKSIMREALGNVRKELRGHGAKKMLPEASAHPTVTVTVHHGAAPEPDVAEGQAKSEDEGDAFDNVMAKVRAKHKG